MTLVGEPEAPPSPPIDPRMRARRVAVRREVGRRRRQRLVRLASVLGVVVAGWLVTRSPVLDVDEVRVLGAERVTADVVAAAAGVHRGDPMTDVDPGAASRGVETVPWVDDAEVRRRWPGTVVIEVSERIPVVTVAADGGGWWLVDATGRLLERSDAPAPGILVVEGPVAGGAAGGTLPARFDDALAIARLVPADLAPAITAVVAPGNGGAELGLRLTGGGAVRLGDARALADKLVAVVTVAGHVDLTCVAVLDVRVPTAPVLTRSEGCA